MEIKVGDTVGFRDDEDQLIKFIVDTVTADGAVVGKIKGATFVLPIESITWKKFVPEFTQEDINRMRVFDIFSSSAVVKFSQGIGGYQGWLREVYGRDYTTENKKWFELLIDLHSIHPKTKFTN